MMFRVIKIMILMIFIKHLLHTSHNVHPFHLTNPYKTPKVSTIIFSFYRLNDKSQVTNVHIVSQEPLLSVRSQTL